MEICNKKGDRMKQAKYVVFVDHKRTILKILREHFPQFTFKCHKNSWNISGESKRNRKCFLWVCESKRLTTHGILGYSISCTIQDQKDKWSHYTVAVIDNSFPGKKVCEHTTTPKDIRETLPLAIAEFKAEIKRSLKESKIKIKAIKRHWPDKTLAEM